MIRQLIKLVWKKRAKNSLLIIELVISFMVLFAVFSLLIYNYGNFFQDKGFNPKDVWLMTFTWPSSDDSVAREKLTDIQKYLNGKQEIEGTAFSRETYPYSYTTMTTTENDIRMIYVSGDTAFFRVLQIPVSEGKEYTLDDLMLRLEPVIMNLKAVETVYPGRMALGQVFGEDSNMVVTGIVEKYRYASSFNEDIPTIFHLMNIGDTNMRRLPSDLLIRVRPGTGRSFEAAMVREISRILPGWSVKVNWLTDLQRTKDNMAMGFIWILIAVAIFLILNVVFGLFGLVWYNINLRKPEIGLRRALGATNGEVTGQFVRETFILTTIAILIGLLFAVQFPLMDVFTVAPWIYLLAIVCSIIFLYGLILISSVIPSRKASEVEPAVALYEE